MGDGRLAWQQGPDETSIFGDRNAVGEAQHVRHAMADVDDADAGGFELIHRREQRFFLAHRQGRCWLVHDEELGAARERLQDLDHLALRETEIADTRRGAQAKAVAIDERLGVGDHASRVDTPPESVRLAQDKEVLRHRSVWEDAQLLEDHRDAAIKPLAQR